MKNRASVICFAFSAAAVTVMRICQLLYTIESNTGFYKNGYSYFSVISAAALIISAAAIALFSFFDPISAKSTRRVKSFLSEKNGCSSFSGDLACLFVAAGFLLLAVHTVSSGVDEVSSVVRLVFELSAVIGYGAFGFLGVIGKPRPALLSVLFVPVWISELITLFVRYNGVAAVPERTYDILMLCLCTLFSLSYAKQVNGVSKGYLSIRFRIFGLYTAFMCIVSTFPRYFVMLLGRADVLHESAVSEPVFLIFGIFSLITVIGELRGVPEKTQAE